MGHVTLPNVNQTGVNQWEDVEGNDRALRDEINGSLDNTNIATGAAVALDKIAAGSSAQIIVANASGVPSYVAMSGDATISNTGAVTLASIADTKLTSPNNPVYRTLAEADGFVAADAGAGTYLLGSHSEAAVTMAVSGTNIALAAVVASNPPRTFRLDDADYTVASKTTKLRLRAQVAANATAPAINFTFGLYPLTVAGGADIITYTAGTVVSGSTVAINTPSASTVTAGTGTDFDVPADGAYLLAVVISGTIANNSGVSCHAQLQMRHV